MSEKNNIRALRDLTGAGLMDCRNVLAETNNDIDKSITILRKKGLAKVSKRYGRETAEGKVFSYIHHGSKIGVLVKLSCETDFVANTEYFEDLGKKICMQIAAVAPIAIDTNSIDKKIIDNEREIIQEQIIEEMKKKDKKPDKKIIIKISEGKLNKYFKENCLLEQPFIQDEKKTIREIIDQAIAKLGENIRVIEYARYQI